MPKPEVIFPAAMILTRSRKSMPVMALWANTRPSVSGEPSRFENSTGAAPVPPSPPSTAMKSGWRPVSTMALQIARNSRRFPDAELEADGLAARPFPQVGEEFEQLARRREGAVRGW